MSQNHGIIISFYINADWCWCWICKYVLYINITKIDLCKTYSVRFYFAVKAPCLGAIFGSVLPGC